MLTFHDGTDKEYSEQILDILKTYKIPATFFPALPQAEQYPEIINREYTDGHLLGNDVHLLGNTEERSKQELSDIRQSLQKISGHSALLIRAPYDMETAIPFTENEIKTLYAMGNI